MLDNKGKIIVGREEITARHVRLAESGLKEMEVPRDYLQRTIAKDVVAKKAGGHTEANSLITHEGLTSWASRTLGDLY